MPKIWKSTLYEKTLAFEKQGFGAFSVVNHIIDQANMFRLYRLSRLISASRIRFIVDFVRQQSDYYYDLTEEGSNMKVPINQKYMLTITEASEYFGIGVKVLRRLVADHQELSIRYGNRWRIIREKMEDYLTRVGLGEEDTKREITSELNRGIQLIKNI